MVKGEIVAPASNSSTVSQDISGSLKQVLDERYLGLLGLDFNVTQINSVVNLQNADTTTGYCYVGNFSAGDTSYFVQCSQSQSTDENSVISNTTQTISGLTNSHFEETTNKTFENSIVQTNYDCVLQDSNSSGNYQMQVSSTTCFDLSSCALLTSNTHVEENFVEPIGNYTIVASPVQSNTSEDNQINHALLSSGSSLLLSITITSPDGNQSNVTVIPNSPI